MDAVFAERGPETEDALRQKGLVLVKHGADLDLLQSQILEARMDSGDAEDFARAYLYVIMPSAENKLDKPIVGPTVDFTRVVVSYLNASGKAKLTPAKDQPPIIQDVLIGGKAFVRVLACVVDELSGIVKWAVKEEPRTGRHTATIVAEKAEGKAFSSHPSYNRKLVNERIKAFLKKQGLDPKAFLIGGGGGPWGDFFARAKKVGKSSSEVREAVRAQTGRGLSEVQTTGEAQAAVAAVDQMVGAPTTGKVEPRPDGSVPLSPPQAKDSAQIMRRLKDAITASGLPRAQIQSLSQTLFGQSDSKALSLDQLERLAEELEGLAQSRGAQA